MKYFIIIFSFITLSFNALAQGDRGRNVEALKIKFLTDKLQLTDEEAKIFWPIYTEMQEEIRTLRQEHYKKMISFRRTTEIESLTDAQIQAYILGDFEFRQKDLNLEKKYYNKLKTNLPIKLVGKFYRTQENFKRELLNRYRKN